VRSGQGDDRNAVSGKGVVKMPLRVMLVDDESLIRNLIRMKLDWGAYGMEVSAEAGGGAEALALVEQDRPDIIFTDISMPDMNGLELSRRITEKYPGIKIVIITGHDDFEYARKGLQLGIVDYFLKPIKTDELKAVAEKLADMIQEERMYEQEYTRMRELLEANRPVLRERFLCSLMIDGGSVEETAKQFDYFGLPLRGDAPMEIAVIDVHHPGNTGEEQRLLFETQCASIVGDFFGESPAVVFSDYWRRIVLLTSYEPEQGAALEALLDKLREFARRPVSIGVGVTAKNAASANASYIQACDALDYRVVAGENKVIFYEDIVLNKLPPGYEDAVKIEKLMFYVKAGAAKQTAKLLEEIMAFAPPKQGGQTLYHMRMKAMDIVAASQHLTAEYASTTESEALGFLFAETLPEIKDGLAAHLLFLAEAAQKSMAEKSDSVVSRAKAYISEHMAEEDLRLATVAASLFISPGHLGRLLKKDTGKSFVEHLTDIRIKRAAELLRSTSLKGYEVGERVGIYDPHYFSILFKKATGMSVNEFRGGEALH
jgi:two-component system response regulator YesN